VEERSFHLAEGEEGGEAGEGRVGYVIEAEGVSEDVLRVAEAWLNESGCDALAALVNLSARTLLLRSVMSSGMHRGALDVWSEKVD
jgi:hypothetical protein